MIVRIVKMTFQGEKINDFLSIFHSEREKIRAFEGCRHVELLNDIHSPDIFFTRSLWESEVHLENYRNSDFFKATWGKTKKLFAAKPEVWSLKHVDN